MHEERDTLWCIVKDRESHYVTVLDMYENNQKMDK